MKRIILLSLTWSFIHVSVYTNAGAQMWAKTYGAGGEETVSAIQQTLDGGYIVSGSTNSFGAGGVDFLVIKLESSGAVSWQKTFGLSGDDFVSAIQQTSDGGYIVSGYTNSLGAGGYDVLAIKLSSNAGVSFNRIYGGSSDDFSSSVNQVFDEEGEPDGFIIAGYTDSIGEDGSDVWVIRMNVVGFISWQKTYGGSGKDRADSIQPTSDGGYILTGETTSFGSGESDILVLKLDSQGDISWQKTYGGSGKDRADSIQPTLDGGYILTGETTSSGSGGSDILVLKLDSQGDISWQRTYGSSGEERAYSIGETLDGGYIVAGETTSSGSGGSDILVLKLDSQGDISWQRTYGSSGEERASSIQQVSDGGFAVGGDTDSFGAGGSDFSVFHLNSYGDIQDCDIMGPSDVSVSDTALFVQDDAANISEVDATSAATNMNPDNSSTEVFSICPWEDSDGDGIPDGMPGDTLCSGGRTVNCADNCPDAENPDQKDRDGDGIGDACDQLELCPAEKLYGEHSATTERLRDFRDDVLSKAQGGRRIIRAYYRRSSGIVKAMEAAEAFKLSLKALIY